MPPSVVTWIVSRSNLAQQIGGLLNQELIEFLSKSSLAVLIGAYLYLIVLKSIISFIKHYAKPEREINRDDILGLLYTINEVVGDKMKRFTDLAKLEVDPNHIFFELTKPEQQINLLMAALKATFEHIDQTNSFIRSRVINS